MAAGEVNSIELNQLPVRLVISAEILNLERPLPGFKEYYD